MNIGKKIFSSKSKIIIKKKRYYESENLSLDSSKSRKFLNWRTHLSAHQALNMTFEWFRIFYKNERKQNIVNFSLNQIKSFLEKTNF